MSEHEETTEEPLGAEASDKMGIVDADIENSGDKGLDQQLEEAMQQLDQYNEKFLRMAADFDNTKKRLAREREISLKYAEENLLRELLPSIDNLERALEQSHEIESAASLIEGVEMTLGGLLGCLKKFGLQPVESVGQQFDPNFHEAIAMEHSEVGENLIVKEYQKGYLCKDRLLRAAKVVVSKGATQDE